MCAFMCKMKFQIIIHKVLKVILYVTGMFLCKNNPLQTADAFNYLLCLLNPFASVGTVNNSVSLKHGVFRRCTVVITCSLEW
jgi:hypothetical protein